MINLLVVVLFYLLDTFANCNPVNRMTYEAASIARFYMYVQHKYKKNVPDLSECIKYYR